MPNLPAVKKWSWLSEDSLITLLLATEVGPPVDDSKWNMEILSVASVIKNRVEDTHGEFKRQTTVQEVILAPYQFSAVGSANWNAALRGEGGWGSLLEKIAKIWSVAKTVDIGSDAVLYYSPVSMVPKGAIPNWRWDLLTEVTPVGVNRDRFRFFTYTKT